jgi:hypothetical protein
MTDKQAPRAFRETWVDWLPAGVAEPPVSELLLRSQVLGWLTARRMTVKESDLRYWEGCAVLPHPVRRWHAGAVRALYPPWYPLAVRVLFHMQAGRRPLAAIGQDLRAWVLTNPALTAPTPPGELPIHERPYRLQPIGEELILPYSEPLLLIDDATQQGLEAFAGRLAATKGGTAVQRIMVWVTLADGQEIGMQLAREATASRPAG